MNTLHHIIPEITENALLKRIKSVVLAIEPSATLALYGSRARGEATAESDWDILIVVEGAVSHSRKTALWDALYLLELETGESIGATIKSRSEWNENPIVRASAFYQNLEREALEY